MTGPRGIRRPGRVAPVRLDPDRALVAAARVDPTRFEALYRRYLARVYSFAYYELRDHADAEDATERTFVADLTNLHRFEERAGPDDGAEASTFRIWLFRIARNVITDERRRRTRRPTLPLDAALGVADPLDVAGTVERRDVVRHAWRAIDRLDDDRRRAIVLRFVDELSTAEIASVLGKSDGAVRVLLHRALRAVARELRRSDR